MRTQTKAGTPRGRRLQQVRDKACVCSALNYSTCDSLESGLRKARAGGIPAPLRVQLIVCFLPVQADVRAGRTAIGSAGCLHARGRASTPVRLRNGKIFGGEGLRSADTEGRRLDNQCTTPPRCFLLSLHCHRVLAFPT